MADYVYLIINDDHEDFGANGVAETAAQTNRKIQTLCCKKNGIPIMLSIDWQCDHFTEKS